MRRGDILKKHTLDKHSKFQGKINKDTLAILNELYQVINGNLESISENTQKKVLKEIDSNKLQFRDLQLKLAIYYQRYYILIEKLLKEYRELNSEERNELIDYYLFDNRLKELNCIGLSYYYDCKFKRTQATLFRSDGKIEITPINYNESDNILILERIFNYCREHINKGNDKVILRSYSKCFGTVIFKYLSIIEGNKSVRLCIRPDSNVNVIVSDGRTMSLQKYIGSRPATNRIDFCIDMSNVRNKKRDNLTIWMKSFLGEDSCEIQKIHSPVSDKEVIMSFAPKNELYFDFKEDELVYLLYRYYRKYYEQNKKTEGEKFDDNFNGLIAELKKELSQNLNHYSEEDEIQKSKNIEQYIMNIEAYIKDADKLTVDKVNEVFDYINWDKESLSEDKDIDSVYKNETSNSNINIFKLLLHKFLINM